MAQLKNIKLIDIKSRIDFLTKELNEHNYRYYQLASPTISDSSFDKLLSELKQLETENPSLLSPNSPTQRVGGYINKEFEQVTHIVPMLSLDNTYSLEDLQEFDSRILKRLNLSTIDYVCEPKIDGVSISLIYENGLLKKAITRGDGVQGDDITENVKTIGSIPIQLETDNFPNKFEVRGEIFMTIAGFNSLNKKRINAGETPFANPRNATAGTLKMLDSSVVAKRPLDCFVYYLYCDEKELISQYSNLEYLKQMGFKVNDNIKLCHNINEVSSHINYIESLRELLLYEIDGTVIKVNLFNYTKTLGFTSKSPRWAIAYKYKAVQAISKVISIDYQVGRTGVITPVANLEPVNLAGTTIKRASLHNSDIIESLDIRINDCVIIEKGGDIIPKIVSVKFDNRHEYSEKLKFISNCPECGCSLTRNEGEAAWYCTNSKYCPPQIKGSLEHFIQRKAMNIDSLGEGKIEVLYENKLVSNVADIYDLTFEKLYGISKDILNEAGERQRTISFKEKTVNNILNGIKNSISTPFEKALFALSIRHVGENTAKKLVQHFKSIDNIINATYEQLIETEEIGDKIAKSIIQYFSDNDNLGIINRLKNHGLEFKSTEQQLVSNKLSGLVFVISGVFTVFDGNREKIKEEIIKNGGKISSSISSKTNYILAGEKMGIQKLQKAKQLSIKIINEDDFCNMIKNNNNTKTTNILKLF